MMVFNDNTYAIFWDGIARHRKWLDERLAELKHQELAGEITEEEVEFSYRWVKREFEIRCLKEEQELRYRRMVQAQRNEQ